MHRPLTSEEIAQLKATHRERLTRPAHELDGLKRRLTEQYGALGDDERSRMVDRLRSVRLP